MPARTLMFQGTGSDVGKSLIVAGLARAYTRRGLAVRPFKPQNMSNNAAVTSDGGEIGRAQALQARAAGIPASVHMNPVLLKPQSEIGAQIVVQGRIYGSAKAAAYQEIKRDLLPYVLDSYARLRGAADIILVEGAGSAAEVNLRANDIANMGFAQAADVPVVLIGDIDRGGVIASLIGTKAVLAPEDAARVCGFIVNKFRGDAALFAEGMARIAQATGWEALGLVPHFADARLLPAEDALALERRAPPKPDARVRIVVPILPHIANFDDLDPLDAEPDVDLVYVRPGEALPGDADLVVLPGSKATIADLAALRAAGFDIDIAAHRRRGGVILGLCGGYQMLGRRIADPGGIEGPAATVEGLGLLDVATTLSAEKRLEAASGTTSERRAVSRLRNAYRRDTRPGLRAAIRPPCGWFTRRRGFGRWPGDRHLHARPVRRRPAACGMARSFQGRCECGARRFGGADARCVRRASGRTSRSRSPPQPSAMMTPATEARSAIRIASAER